MLVHLLLLISRLINRSELRISHSKVFSSVQLNFYSLFHFYSFHLIFPFHISKVLFWPNMVWIFFPCIISTFSFFLSIIFSLHLQIFTIFLTHTIFFCYVIYVLRFLLLFFFLFFCYVIYVLLFFLFAIFFFPGWEEMKRVKWTKAYSWL